MSKQITLVSKFKLWAELVKFDGRKFSPTGESSTPNTWHDDGDGTVTVTVDEEFRGAVVLHHEELGPAVKFVNIGEAEQEAFPVPRGAIVNPNPYSYNYRLAGCGREWLRALALDAAGYARAAWSVVSAQTGGVWLALKGGGFAVSLPHECDHASGAAFLIEDSSGKHQIIHGYFENTPVYRDGVILREREWQEEYRVKLEPVVSFFSKGGKASQLFNAAKRRWPEELVKSAFAQTHPTLAKAWCQ